MQYLKVVAFSELSLVLYGSSKNHFIICRHIALPKLIFQARYGISLLHVVIFSLRLQIQGSICENLTVKPKMAKTNKILSEIHFI